jgi:hypothetical protein
MAVIGNLVANLVADTSAFTAPMVQAQGTIQDVGRSIQRSGSIASGVFSGLAKFAGMAMVFRGVTSSISGMVAGAVDAQKSGAKLDAVLASTGGAAGVSGDEIRKLAGDLQLVTDFEDDATIAAAGVLATFTQVRGDVFKDAIVSAQNLSAVMGQDLQSSVVQIGKALNDPIKGITALSRVGVSFTEQQKQQITQMTKAGDIAGAQAMILRELQTEFGGAAEAMSSPFTRIGNIVGDVAEGIGSVFLPSLEAVASMITASIIPAADSMGERFRSAGVSLRDAIVPTMQNVIARIANIGTYLDLLWAKTFQVFVQIGNSASYFFTDQLPAYFTWFLDNWGNLWTDALSITQTSFSNLATNVSTNMKSIWDYIASGGTTALEFAWTPLLDGFKATVSELPKIADRIPSELEKTLGEMVSGLQGKLQNDMAATMEGLQQEADKKPITPRMKKTPAEEAAAPVKAGNVAAAQAGTREALSAIFGSMKTEDYQKELVALQQQGLQIQQQQLDALEGIAADEGEGID